METRVLLAVVLMSVPAMGQPSVIERLADLLDAQVKRVPYLRIVAHCSVERPASEGQVAKRIAECSITVVRTTRPLGQMYVSMNPDILHTDRGGFYEQVTEVCYDGRIGSYLRRKAGPEGQTSDWNTGWVGSDRPKELIAATEYCGWTSTAHGMADQTGKRFSDGLRRWLRRGGAANGSTVVAKAVDEGYVLLFQAEKESRELRFDWNGALTLRQDRSGGVITRETRLEGFEFVDNALPYPKHVIDLRYDGKGVLVTRREIHVKEVSAPADPRFAIDYPPGASLDDRVMGRIVKIGSNPKEMAELVRDEVLALRDAQQTARPAIETSPSSGGWWARVIAGCCVGIVVFILFLVGRRARSAIAAAACLACVLAPAPAQAKVVRSQIDPVFRLLPEERVYNCGVYVCAVARSFFGQEVDPDALAKALGVGGSWIKPASLARIGKVLEGFGLAVSGFENADYAGLEKALEGGPKISILHQKKGKGHFLVAVRGKNGGLYVRDVGSRGVWIRPGVKEHDEFLATWSGFAIVVSAPNQKVVSAPSKKEEWIDLLAVDHLKIDMGEMDRRVRNYAHAVSVENRSDQDLHIENIKSSCSCVEDAYFDKGKTTLRAGARGKLWLRVSPSQLKLGRAQRKATVRVRHGEASRSVPVLLSGIVVNKGLNRSAFAVPKKLDMGLCKVGSDVEDMVNVIVPDGVDVEVSVDGDIAIEPVGVAPYDLEFKGKTYSYMVKPTRHSGRVEAAVVFSFTGGAIEVLKLPIAVEWR